MKFQKGDFVAAVLHYHFFNHIANGNYAICQIYEAEPYGNKGNYIYRAKDVDGNIYTGFDFNVSMSPHEIVPLDYLKEVINRYKFEAMAKCTLYDEKLKALKDKIAEEGSL